MSCFLTRVPRGRVEQFVLNLGKENLCILLADAVVRTQRQKIAHLLVKPLLRSQNLANPRQQLVEIISATGVLQLLVIHEESFDEVFLELGVSPLPKLGSP